MDLIESYSQELRLIDKPWKGFWIALLVIALLLLPWFGSSHLIYVGTVIFVYAIGLQSGHGFFAAFRKRGLRFSIISFLILLVGALASLAMPTNSARWVGL